MTWQNIRKSKNVKKCNDKKMTVRNNVEKAIVLSDHGYKLG